MPGNPDVFALLEEMLDSGRTAEEVCRDCPELLPEVRRRWQTFRLVDGSVAALFPDPETPAATDTTGGPEVSAMAGVPVASAVRRPRSPWVSSRPPKL